MNIKQGKNFNHFSCSVMAYDHEDFEDKMSSSKIYNIRKIDAEGEYSYFVDFSGPYTIDEANQVIKTDAFFFGFKIIEYCKQR